jgi:hypothetical protein
MAADIISDIFTAWSLFSRSEICSKCQDGGLKQCKNFMSQSLFTSNYFKWGVYTLIAIVMPLIARIVLNLISLIRSLEMKGCRITITLAQCFPKSGPRTIFGPRDFLYWSARKLLQEKILQKTQNCSRNSIFLSYLSIKLAISKQIF